MSVKQRIVAEIEERGPMPFERFMDLALYHSGGFFASDQLRSQKAGDFLTSPEVSPLFGETLAVYVEQERDRIGEPFQLIEVGAGSGSLLGPLLDIFPVDVIAIEASSAAREALSGLVPVSEHLPDRLRGVVVANELVDNLPMALAQRIGGTWRERWVALDGDGLAFVDAEPRPHVLSWLDAYAGDVPDDGWVEVQLAAREWLTEMVARLEAGSVLVIDYGDTAENLIPRRKDGTLRTYRAHHLGPHPLDEPGETDITADVNFTALVDVTDNAQLVRQDDFLTGLGLRQKLREIRHQELEAARRGEDEARLRLRSLKTEAETLLHPRGLGDFRVLIVEV